LPIIGPTEISFSISHIPSDNSQIGVGVFAGREAFVTLVSDPSAQETEVLTERRRGLRVAQQRPAKVFDAAANRYIGGCTADVSSSGLRLELPAWAPVAEGRTLSIHVGATGSPLASHQGMIPARVVWVGPRQLVGRSTVTVGIEYLASASAHLEAA
jgi:hypothetical protein